LRRLAGDAERNTLASREMLAAAFGDGDGRCSLTRPMGL